VSQLKLADVLRRAREKFIAGQHIRFGELDAWALLNDAAGGDPLLAERAMRALDNATPGFEKLKELADSLQALAKTDEDLRLVADANMTASAFELWLSEPVAYKTDEIDRVFQEIHEYSHERRALIASVFGRACVRAQGAES
jgi:hypothetical protein